MSRRRVTREDVYGVALKAQQAMQVWRAALRRKDPASEKYHRKVITLYTRTYALSQRYIQGR